MKTGKRSIILGFTIFCLYFYKSNNVFSDSIEKEKEFILYGFRHNISLIKDAQAEFRINDEKGQIKKEGKWFFKPGSERIDLKEISPEGIVKVSYIYTDANTYKIEYNDKIESVSLGLSLYHIQKEIRSAFAPSFIFLHLWPVGASIEELIIQSSSYKSENFEGTKCFRIEVPRFVKEFKGYGKTDYPNLGYKIWLSSEEGFVPKKIEIYMKERMVMEIGPIVINKFGDNIWFPKETKIIWYSEGNKKSEGYIQYSNIKINSGIEDKIFSPVFSPGTKVFDYQTGKTFTIPEK